MPSACGAPTAFACTATVVESTVIIAFSGAKAGTDNAINGYEFRYSDSSDNVSWGSWVTLGSIASTSTSGSASTNPAATRGYYRRFQIRTKGTAGASYYSPWFTSTNSVRKNTIPVPPTQIIASPQFYTTQNITLMWSGTVAGASGIKGYMVASKTSTDGINWTEWNVIDEMISTSATSYSYQPAVTHTYGTQTKFGVWTIDGCDLYSNEGVSNYVFCGITICGEPSIFTVTPSVAEVSATLNWSGAGGGINNGINSYEIEYSDSNNGSNWGSWAALTTVSSTATSGSTSVSPPQTRGNYRRFQIRTRGSAGSAYYSVWKISGNLRKNILPTAPTVFTTSNPAMNFVSLEFEGTVQGTSSIVSYLIQMSIFGSGWGAWQNLITLDNDSTSGGISMQIPEVANSMLKFRISVTDSLGGVSGFKNSNILGTHTEPLAPSFGSPKMGSYCYNHTPRYLIETQDEPDGHQQTLIVLGSDGNYYNSVDNADMFTVSGTSATSIKTIFTNPQTPSGFVTVEARCDDDFDTGSAIGVFFNLADVDFENILPNETHVKASHIVGLRAAINNVRDYYNMPPVTWQYPCVSGKTNVAYWTYHVINLRVAVDAVVDRINNFSGVQVIAPIDWIQLGSGRPRADVMVQLKDVILSL
jgi:hypothetical protein